MAIHRAMGNTKALVGAVEVWFPYTHYLDRVGIKLPQKAIDFIFEFDSRKNNQPYPEPFEFELDLPLSKQQEK